MSSVSQNYDNNSADNYNPPTDGVQSNSDTEYDNYNNEIDGASSSDSSDDPFGDSSEGAVDPAAARDELRALQKQVKQLSPESQKAFEDTLKSLDLELAKLGPTVDGKFEQALFDHTMSKLNEVEGQVVEFTVNGDQINKDAETLKELEAKLKDNKYLTSDERKAYLKQIQEIREKLFKGEGDLSTFEEDMKPFQNRLDATKDFETEDKRTAGLGNQIASDLDKAFSGSAVDGSNPWATALSGSGEGVVAGAVVGAALGGAVTTGIALATAPTWGAIGLAALGPAGWGVLAGAAVVGGVIDYAFTETEKPKSGFEKNGAPQALADFDAAMGMKSGLLGSKVPSELAQILYRTDISGEEQVKLMQQSLSTLPVGSQGIAISMVTTILNQRDPAKLQFLAKYSPGVIDFMTQTLKSNESAIKTGMLPSGDYKGYSIKFEDGKYKRHNTDTEILRNDWDDDSFDPNSLAAPITSAIGLLQGLPQGDATAAEPPPATDAAAAA